MKATVRAGGLGRRGAEAGVELRLGLKAGGLSEGWGWGKPGGERHETSFPLREGLGQGWGRVA